MASAVADRFDRLGSGSSEYKSLVVKSNEKTYNKYKIILCCLKVPHLRRKLNELSQLTSVVKRKFFLDPELSVPDPARMKQQIN